MAENNTNPTANLPPLLDLTIDNITPNTIRINSQASDARLKYLMARLVTHLHDFARETRLSSDEWVAALQFLISCGKICSDVRNVSFLLFRFSRIYCCFFIMTTTKVMKIGRGSYGVRFPHLAEGRVPSVLRRGREGGVS